MFEENFKKELISFLPKEDVELIEQDITNIINKFPLDAPNRRNYLNILINVFLRYRTHSTNAVADICNLPLLEIGSNPKEITIKQNRLRINFYEFKNIDNYFTKIDLTNLDKYFIAIRLNVENSLKIIDFSKNSYEQRMSQAINEFQAHVFDYEGQFYSYINITLETSNNEVAFPDKKQNDEVIEKIYDMIRFYAWMRASLSWSEVTTEKEISVIPINYQSTQWFFDGYYKRSTPFNVYSPKRYGQYIEAIKEKNFKQYQKRIDKVFEFTTTLVPSIKDLYTILNNSPFAVQKENRSNLFNTFKKVIGLQFASENYSFSLQDITNHFKTLQSIFTDLDLSLEEFYDLNSANILESLLVLIAKQVEAKLLPVEFPFTLIWQPKDQNGADDFINKYSLTLESSSRQLIEFLLEFTHGGINKQNFSIYFEKMINIAELQKKLLGVGDVEEYDLVKFTHAKYLLTKEENYEFMDFKKLNEIENDIRQSLNNLKHLWVHDINSDPIFVNDPTFKSFFPLTLGKEKIEYVPEIEAYLEKWNDYKQQSDAITKLQDIIKIVSTVKFKLEGEELVSGDYPGAISLIKAQKIVTRENTRLLLKLKDLISSVVKFKYVDGLNITIDPKILNETDDTLISESISILDKIINLKEEIGSVDLALIVAEANQLSDFIKTLLGQDSRVTQLKRFSETTVQRFNKMKRDPIIINTGLHLTNLNDSIANFIGVIKTIKESFEKYYANSFSKELFDQVTKVTTTHNLQEMVIGVKSINENIISVVNGLKETFTDVSTYFDVYADITYQLMLKYGRLISRNDFYSRLDNSRIKFYEDNGSVVITDKIDPENASILEKQIFMEKTFSLYTIVSRSCNQISFAVNRSFNNLVVIGEVPTEKLERSFEVAKKVEIITKMVDSYYKFMDTIKFPSRKYIQSIKGSLKSINSTIEPIKPVSKMVVELSNANKLMNALSKNRDTINYGLLRKLNDSLSKMLRLIDTSVLTYFENIASNETKKEEISQFLSVENKNESYTRKLSNKLHKVKSLTIIDKNALLTTPLQELLNNTHVEQPQVVQTPAVDSNKEQEVINTISSTTVSNEATNIEQGINEELANSELENSVEVNKVMSETETLDTPQEIEPVISEDENVGTEPENLVEDNESTTETLTEAVIEEHEQTEPEIVPEQELVSKPELEVELEQEVMPEPEPEPENVIETTEASTDTLSEEVSQEQEQIEPEVEQKQKQKQEPIYENIIEEQEEEIDEELLEEKEPESNQLEEESDDLELEDSTDNYEPEKLEEESDNDDQDDLISEMEKLLNTGSDDKKKSK